MKVKADAAKDSGQLRIFTLNKLQNFGIALTHVRFDVITVTFMLISVALSQPSFHLSRGRNKLGLDLTGRTDLRSL